MRQEDLTQKPGENLVEYRNRAERFEKEIEKFHSHLIEKGYSINSARNMTFGIRQLFRIYQMPVGLGLNFNQDNMAVQKSVSFFFCNIDIHA